MLNKIKTVLKSLTFHRINFNRKFIIVSAVAFIVALSWSAKAWLSSPINAAPIVHTARVQSFTPGEERDKAALPTIQTESVMLKTTGFEPKEFSRQASPFILSIHNRTSAFNLSFELLREDGRKLHDIKGPKGQVHPMKLIDLPPGAYLLKEVNHPEWTCRIALTR